jgi:hypothetical protein
MMPPPQTTLCAFNYWIITQYTWYPHNIAFGNMLGTFWKPIRKFKIQLDGNIVWIVWEFGGNTLGTPNYKKVKTFKIIGCNHNQMSQ